MDNKQLAKLKKVENYLLEITGGEYVVNQFLGWNNNDVFSGLTFGIERLYVLYNEFGQNWEFGSLKSYKEAFESLYDNYKVREVDGDKRDFINSEIVKFSSQFDLSGDTPSINFRYEPVNEMFYRFKFCLVCDNNIKPLITSNRKKIEYLEYLLKPDAKLEEATEELKLSTIDLDSIKEQIRLLEDLGVISFLIQKYSNALVNPSQVSRLVSQILKQDYRTIQPYVNALMNDNGGDKYPMKTSKVDKILNDLNLA